MFESSPHGSSISSGAVYDSSIRGTTCRRIGQFGSFRSISPKKCGVIPKASFFPAKIVPALSSPVSSSLLSSCSRVWIRLRSCQVQSPQFSGETVPHVLGLEEGKSFALKVKPLKIHHLSSCATPNLATQKSHLNH